MGSNFKWIAILLLALGLVGCGSWWLINAQAQSQAIPPSIPNAATVFEPILGQIKTRQVPVRLPTYIPSVGQFPAQSGTNQAPVYANLNEFESNGYQVILGYSADCAGGNACRLGTVQGEIKPTTAIVQLYQSDDYLYSHRSQEQLSEVVLANNIQGWFLPWRCATSCSDATVVWEEGNYRYAVGIKAGDKASLVKMANSAIQRSSK